MTIEGGARAGLIQPDEKVFEYLKHKPMSPKNENWDKALEYWETLKSDHGSKFDKEINLEGNDIKPMVTWGTSPQDVVEIDGQVPNPDNEKDEDRKSSIERSLNYMGLKPNTKVQDIKIDKVFIGSCTNGRIEDFREFTRIVKGKQKASNVTAWLVPGSHKVEKAIKDEGLLKILNDSGFELREPGCSACLAMNDDKIPAGKYAVSTSNRNFEGRQGPGSRTLLASPLVAAAAAITGKITDPRTLI